MILTATISNPPLSLAELRRLLSAAVGAGLDAVFFLGGSPPAAAYDPLVAIAALAELALPIGLGGGVAIDFSEPFHVARSFAAIDRLTGGRSALVVDAGAHLETACGHSVPPAERPLRRREFFEVLEKLWDSWEDDALLVDRPGGLFTDPSRIHRINHDGPHYVVRGPLNAPRPLQGAPVIVAHAATGPDLAAAVADVVLVEAGAARDGSGEFLARLAGQGRARDAVKILADVTPNGEWPAGSCDGCNLAFAGAADALAFLATLPAVPAVKSGTLRARLGLARRPSRYAA